MQPFLKLQTLIGNCTAFIWAWALGFALWCSEVLGLYGAEDAGTSASLNDGEPGGFKQLWGNSSIWISFSLFLNQHTYLKLNNLQVNNILLKTFTYCNRFRIVLNLLRQGIKNSSILIWNDLYTLCTSFLNLQVLSSYSLTVSSLLFPTGKTNDQNKATSAFNKKMSKLTHSKAVSSPFKG